MKKNVDGLNLAKANQIITKFLTNDKVQFILVGKPLEIKKIIEKFDKVTEIDE